MSEPAANSMITTIIIWFSLCFFKTSLTGIRVQKRTHDSVQVEGGIQLRTAGKEFDVQREHVVLAQYGYRVLL